MERRIAAPKGFSSLLDRLTTPQHPNAFAFFETKQKALMFAAAYGRYLGSPVEDSQRDATTAIRYDIFEKKGDDGYVAALAAAEVGGLHVLGPDREEEFASVFERYIHRGLQELSTRVDSGVDILNELVAVVGEGRSSEQPEELDGLDASVLTRLMGGS